MFRFLVTSGAVAFALWVLLQKGSTRHVHPPKQIKTEEDNLDTASEDSFPASDPPAWTGTHA